MRMTNVEMMTRSLRNLSFRTRPLKNGLDVDQGHGQDDGDRPPVTLFGLAGESKQYQRSLL